MHTTPLDRAPKVDEALAAAAAFPFEIGTLDVPSKDLIEYFVSISWMAPLDHDHPRRRRVGTDHEFKQCRDMLNIAARQLEPEKRFHIFYNRETESYDILSMPDAVKKDPGMRRVRGISKFRLREFVKNVKASADGQLAGESMGKHIEAIKKGHEIVQEVTGKLSELTQILTGNKPAKPEPELSPKLPPKKPARPETRGRLRRGRAMHRSPHGPSAA